jgi:putative transposase
MSRGKKHTQTQIATKLAEAEGLASQGKLQSEIASALGVSVMTLHRWRNASTANEERPIAVSQQELSKKGLSDLQDENLRLRRLVIDLLFEKMKLKDTVTPRAASQNTNHRPLGFSATRSA